MFIVKLLSCGNWQQSMKADMLWCDNLPKHQSRASSVSTRGRRSRKSQEHKLNCVRSKENASLFCQKESKFSSVRDSEVSTLKILFLFAGAPLR